MLREFYGNVRAFCTGHAWEFMYLAVGVTFVTRLFYPGREVSWQECQPDFAHMVIGALFVLGCQGHKRAWYMFWGLTLFEVVMFGLFKAGYSIWTGLL